MNTDMVVVPIAANDVTLPEWTAGTDRRTERGGVGSLAQLVVCNQLTQQIRRQRLST